MISAIRIRAMLPAVAAISRDGVRVLVFAPNGMGHHAPLWEAPVHKATPVFTMDGTQVAPISFPIAITMISLTKR